MSRKPTTTGDRLRTQHQWHARFARVGFLTLLFPIEVYSNFTPPVSTLVEKADYNVLDSIYSQPSK